MMEQELNNSVRSLVAIIVLHNFCLLNDDSEFDVSDSDDEDENALEMISNVSNFNILNEETCVTVANAPAGEDVRNAIMDYMVEKGMLF